MSQKLYRGLNYLACDLSPHYHILRAILFGKGLQKGTFNKSGHILSSKQIGVSSIKIYRNALN